MNSRVPCGIESHNYDSKSCDVNHNTYDCVVLDQEPVVCTDYQLSVSRIIIKGGVYIEGYSI